MFGVCVLVGGLFWLVCAICLCCIVCDSDFLCVVLFGVLCVNSVALILCFLFIDVFDLVLLLVVV